VFGCWASAMLAKKPRASTASKVLIACITAPIIPHRMKLQLLVEDHLADQSVPGEHIWQQFSEIYLTNKLF
jgi:hypothetical protein